MEALERHLSERQSFSRSRETSVSPRSRHTSSNNLPPMGLMNPLSPVMVHSPHSERHPSLTSTPRDREDYFRVPSSPSPALNYRCADSLAPFYTLDIQPHTPPTPPSPQCSEHL